MANHYAIANHFPLNQCNSMRLSASAATVLIPYDVRGINELFADPSLKEFNILGKGSNIIFSKEKYEIPFILTDHLCNIIYDGEYIISDCGVTLSQLAWFALEKSISGYEFLEDIPGSVGEVC